MTIDKVYINQKIVFYLCFMSELNKIFHDRTSLKVNTVMILCVHIDFSPPELQSVFWILAEFCYNRSLQRLYTGTCIILQKTINGFLCLLIVFLKSKTHQLNLKDLIKLNRNLQQLIEIKLLLAICSEWYWLKSIYLIKAVFNSSSQQTVTIIEILEEF